MLTVGSLTLARPAAAEPAAVQPAVAEQARELYRKGARSYNLGQFEAALAAFEQAYALSGAKPLLFNIAQAHRLAGPEHCERALQAYTGYLREEPNTSNADEVRQRIDEMKSCAERERKDAETVEKEPTKPAAAKAGPTVTQQAQTPALAPLPPLHERSVAPVVTTVAGAALAVTGGLIYWRARVKFNEVEASCPCAEGQFSSWQTLTTTSYALMAVGGSALVGGAIWWALDRKQASPTRYGLVLRPNGVGLFGAF